MEGGQTDRLHGRIVQPWVCSVESPENVIMRIEPPKLYMDQASSFMKHKVLFYMFFSRKIKTEPDDSDYYKSSKHKKSKRSKRDKGDDDYSPSRPSRDEDVPSVTS